MHNSQIFKPIVTFKGLCQVYVLIPGVNVSQNMITGMNEIKGINTNFLLLFPPKMYNNCFKSASKKRKKKKHTLSANQYKI